MAAVIREFERGMLACPAGTTLRSYLSEKLHCDPMRITKKFAGDASIGKRVFTPCKQTPELQEGARRAARHGKEICSTFAARVAGLRGVVGAERPGPRRVALRAAPAAALRFS